MTQDIEAEIRRLLALVLAIPTPVDALRRADEPRWNSLKHVELIFALEDHFGVQFTEDEMTGLDSIAAIVAAVKRHK